MTWETKLNIRDNQHNDPPIDTFGCGDAVRATVPRYLCTMSHTVTHHREFEILPVILMILLFAWELLMEMRLVPLPKA